MRQESKTLSAPNGQKGMGGLRGQKKRNPIEFHLHFLPPVYPFPIFVSMRGVYSKSPERPDGGATRGT